MPTPKETFNYCEELIEEEINSWIIASHLYTQGQALATFKLDNYDDDEEDGMINEMHYQLYLWECMKENE
jgi:hypothetical protein